jgi:hypothetical protein
MVPGISSLISTRGIPCLLSDTGEVAEVSLTYKEPEDLPIKLQELPDDSWPRPRPHRFPFDGGLVDYMRPVGPGVFVGCGWKETPASGLVGERFLTFVLVRRLTDESGFFA